MVEAAGVELDSPYFPQIVICRAFLLNFSQLDSFIQSSIDKISSISSIKIKIFYTKFTPRSKISIQKFVPASNHFFLPDGGGGCYVARDGRLRIPSDGTLSISLFANQIVKSKHIGFDNRILKHHNTHLGRL